MAIYANIKGKVQGAISGSVTTTGFENQIEVYSLEFGLGGGFDSTTGTATGRRVARPIQLVKPLDKSSPLLFTSCNTNEALTVDISYNTEGGDHKKFATISLTNAMIRNFSHHATFHGTAAETLTITYTKLEFTWVAGGIVSTQDWMSSP